MKAGTVRCAPFTKIARWAWSWNFSCSDPRHSIPSTGWPVTFALAAASSGPVDPVPDPDDESEPPLLTATATPPMAMTAARTAAHHHDDVRFAFRARTAAFAFGRVAVAVVLFEPEELDDAGRVRPLLDPGNDLFPVALRFFATDSERTRPPAGSRRSDSAGSQGAPSCPRV